MKSILENTNSVRQKIISRSSLPTANFTKEKELKAVKLLNTSKVSLGITTKRKTDDQNIEEPKKVKSSCSLVDYGSSSESD